MDLAAKGLGAKEWNNSLKTKLSLLPKKLFRIRMSRNFGMKMLTMTNLSTECLIQLTKLGYDATPFNQILKQNAKDRKSGSAGMPRPISYAVFCLKKKHCGGVMRQTYQTAPCAFQTTSDTKLPHDAVYELVCNTP